MTVYDAIKTRRTIRRFRQDPISNDDLLKIIDAARLSATGSNRQPLKYIIVSSSDSTKEVFPHTKWAGYIRDGAPKKGERPTAYIAILVDTNIRSVAGATVDCGLALTSMMLCAHELGIGSCALGAIDPVALHDLFKLEDSQQVAYLVALGYPAQKGSSFDIKDNDNKYFYDENGDVHVPKRTISEVLIKTL